MTNILFRKTLRCLFVLLSLLLVFPLVGKALTGGFPVAGAAVSGDQLLDGVMLGFVLLAILMGAIVGVVTSSRLLVLNALVLLCYASLTLVVNGYLLYWPAALPWARELVAVLCAAVFLLCCFFVYTLFCMRFLGRGFNRMALVFAGLTVLMLLQGGYWFWRQFSEQAWLFPGDRFSLQSSFLFVLLLILTLILEFRQLLKRERRALDELSNLQRAEHERLESQVEQRTVQLRESLKARSSLLGRISHDLRSPLNSIINYARESRASPNNEYLERIERHARHQLTFLDDLIAFSRTELQQIELSLAPGYLFGFLHEIEEEGRFLARKNNNVLRCELANDLPTVVSADFQQLRRVLINLLNNAAKFTRDGLIVLQVEVLLRQEHGSVLRFTVRDSGSGFPADSSRQMQQAFQRGSNAAGVEGFGLGLSIVAELLQQMGAALRIESEPGHGSLLSFELDLGCASEEELDTVFQEDYAQGEDGEGVRIVLVDDIALTRAFLGDLLLGYGYDVTTVATAEEALMHLAQDPVDLLITDQLMPGTDGWALLREVRLQYAGLPVLLYSSMPPRPSPSHQYLAFDSALLKPASTEALLDRIQGLCCRSIATG